MALVEHHNVIQALPADRTDDSFGVGVLPWRAWRSYHLCNSHGLDALGKFLAIRSVAVAYQKSRRGIPRECLRHLAREPRRGWIARDVEVDDLPAVVDHEGHKQ